MVTLRLSFAIALLVHSSVMPEVKNTLALLKRHFDLRIEVVQGGGLTATEWQTGLVAEDCVPYYGTHTSASLESYALLDVDARSDTGAR